MSQLYAVLITLTCHTIPEQKIELTHTTNRVKADIKYNLGTGDQLIHVFKCDCGWMDGAPSPGPLVVSVTHECWRTSASLACCDKV